MVTIQAVLNASALILNTLLVLLGENEETLKHVLVM